jgi:hypothetical protein
MQQQMAFSSSANNSTADVTADVNVVRAAPQDPDGFRLSRFETVRAPHRS